MSERAQLLVLAFLAGVCGLAYEVLYSRLLTTYLGDMFYVNGSILTGFLLMLGVGALVAHRLVPHLATVQVCLGGYAALAGLVARLGQDAFLQHVTPLAGSPLAAFLIVLALVAVPAGLSGLSVPLFALWLDARKREPSTPSGAFRAVYAFYNLGAAVCVLTVEFVLLHLLGLSRTLFAIAAVNLAIGLVLRRGWRPGPAPRVTGLESAAAPASPERPVFDPGVAVFVLGVASGIFQLLVLRLAITLFGPYHENFTLVIALGLGTITLGAWLTQRTDAGFGRLATLGALGVPAGFLLWPVAILLWGEIHGMLGSLWLDRGLRLGVLLVAGGPALAFFGATVPAALREQAGQHAAAGRFLALASFGNAAGYVLTLTLARERVSDQTLAGVVGTLVVGVAWLARRPGLGTWRWWLTVPVGAAILGAALGTWPGQLLELSHAHLSDAHVRAAVRSRLRTVAVHRRYGHQVTVLQEPGGAEQLVIDGHLSLVIPPEPRTVPQEFVVGAAPAFLARDRRHALVLGVGTGITAGAATNFFQHVTAVEINPAVLEVLPRYATRNNELTGHPGATILLQDGLTLLASGTGRFDAIINTVTSPRFFSSSKLYTREFFDLAARSLAPGGVYACWFDNEVGPEGAAIMLATLRESFPHVAFLLLRAGYFLVVAGREPLTFTAAPAVDPARLALGYLGLDTPLPLGELVASLMVAGPALLDRAGTAPPNTLDLPALEFALTSRLPGRATGTSVRGFLGVDYRHSWPEASGPLPQPHPLAGARAVALMAMNEPAGVLLVREALRERRFTDEAWSVLLPSLLRQARRMDRADAVLGWAETLLEQDRSAPADQTLRAWVDSIGGSGGRSRRGLEYALWLRARLALRGGRALPADLRAQYLEALRAFRFPYLDTPGRHQVRAAWETLLHAALAGDWVNVPPAAEALQGAAGILPVPEATDARRLAWLLEAAAARAHGQGDAAAERLARIAALYPLDPLPRLELLRSLAPATPAHAAHLRFLARLGPAPGANRPLHRLIALADPPGGPVRPWEAERF